MIINQQCQYEPIRSHYMLEIEIDPVMVDQITDIVFMCSLIKDAQLVHSILIHGDYRQMPPFLKKVVVFFSLAPSLIPPNTLRATTEQASAQ